MPANIKNSNSSVYQPRQTVDKYRIEKRIGDGGFAQVYRAYDTIEGARVALKVPRLSISENALNDFRAEVKLLAKFDHPNILTLKNASLIDKRLVIVTPPLIVWIMNLAIPKSAKRILSPSKIRKFSGLMSQWTTFL